MRAEPLRNCHFCFKTGSYSAAQAGLELMTNLLPQSSGCWDYKYKPPHWVYTLIFWAVTCSFPHSLNSRFALHQVTLWGLLQTYPEVFPEFSRLGKTSLFWGSNIPFATVGWRWTPTIPALRRGVQEDKEFKINLHPHSEYQADMVYERPCLKK